MKDLSFIIESKDFQDNSTTSSTRDAKDSRQASIDFLGQH